MDRYLAHGHAHDRPGSVGESQALEKRLERQAVNEALVRDVNERMAGLDEQAAAKWVRNRAIHAACELCRATPALSRAGRSRSFAGHLLLLPRHAIRSLAGHR
jgi:hypothetical protein